jgi:hypothetical protein
MFPLLFFEVYLLGSVLVFAFGPVGFRIENPFTLYSYVLAGQAAIWFGYRLGSASPPAGYAGRASRSLLLKIAILATVLMAPPTVMNRNSGDISISEAIANPGAAYAARLASLDERSSAPWVSIARVALSPVLGMFVPLGAVILTRQSGLWSSFWKAGLVALLAQSLIVGAAKDIFDLFLVLPWMLWLRFHLQGSSQPDSRQPRTARQQPSLIRKAFTLAIVLGGLGAGIYYFSYSRQSRYGLEVGEYPPWTTGWSQELYGIELPESVEYPIYMVARYWTQGYVGLSECLELPFRWSYGIGHSTFWMRYAGLITGNSTYFLDRSYPYRLEAETGYSVAHYWHTIYPWVASDLTFPGALVFIGLMAFLLARAWSDCLLGENPFALAFFAQALLMFYYIPANNIRLMFSEEMAMFWSLLTLWLATRSRRTATFSP